MFVLFVVAGYAESVNTIVGVPSI